MTKIFGPSGVTVTIEGDSWGDVFAQMEALVGKAPAPTPTPAHRTIEVQAPGMQEEPRHVAETFQPFAPSGAITEFWPVGECPVHHRPFKDGQFGPFCSAQGGNGPLNKKGYCDLKPGAIYGGKGIPLLPVAPPA